MNGTQYHIPVDTGRDGLIALEIVSRGTGDYVAADTAPVVDSFRVNGVEVDTAANPEAGSFVTITQMEDKDAVALPGRYNVVLLDGAFSAGDQIEVFGTVGAGGKARVFSKYAIIVDSIPAVGADQIYVY